jgi:phenylalanyl-tRNA synthetase alpha chain
MPKTDLKSVQNQAKNDIEKAGNLNQLNGVFKKYLGKGGTISQVLRSLEKLPKAQRAKVGKEANRVKGEITKALEEKKNQIESAGYGGKDEWLDITVPGKKPALGHLHPLTLVRRKVEEIFQSMGFSVVEGPEIETPWYNFDALNIPKDHPARDLWDTFYLKNGLLLRTHTSPNQVRYMEKHEPPLRIIVPGNIYRKEATDARHEFQVFQTEGLMVDREISVPHFKAVVSEFFRQFFEKEVKFRLRPDFFSFTEPSFDVSMTCLVCNGRGCSACKNSGWLEMAGAGMVHPNVFLNSGLNPKNWKGWAFGFGLDRLAMMKYKINDIRLLRSGDLRFLEQF